MTGRKIGIRWWQGKALSTLGKEITPSFECTLTHTYNEWLLLTRAGKPAAISVCRKLSLTECAGHTDTSMGMQTHRNTGVRTHTKVRNKI